MIPFQKISSFIIILLTSITLFGQKKVIDYQAFDGWKTLKNEQVSPSGKYISYEIQPHKGDTYLYWYNTETGKRDSVLRAKNAGFSQKENYLIYTIEAGYDTLRKVEIEKVDKKKWPKDSLAVYSFETGKTIKIANIKAHEISNKHNWLSYLENENKLKEAAKATVEKKKSKDDEMDFSDKKKPAAAPAKPKESKSDGKILRLWNIETNDKIAFKDVTEYTISENGEILVYVQQLNDTSTVHVLQLNNFKHQELTPKFSTAEKFAFDKKAENMVFLASKDTSKTKVYELFSYHINSNSVSCLIDTASHQIKKGWTVVKNLQPRFSEGNNLLYFGVNDTPLQDPKDTLTEAEKPKFDLWHYNEPVLQTQQLSSLKRDQNKAYWHAYDVATGSITALENDTISLQSNFYELSEFALASNERPYELEYMWDVSGRRDYYLTNLKTGEKNLIKKGVTSAVELSRKGNLFVYFNHQNGNYYSIDLTDKKENCITCSATGKTWSGDNNGMPMELSAIGNQGWNKEGTQIFLNEKNDFYVYDFTKNELTNLSQSLGATTNIEFTPHRFTRDSSFVSLTDFYLIGLDKKTKGSHFYTFENAELKKQAYWDAKVTSFKKAKNAPVFAIRKQTVSDYPELSFWKEDISQIQQISKTNPQQAEYNWATVELISWKTKKGLDLEGLVYKPENFDPSKKYPLLVYYYELYSDDLHSHYAPRPTASIIFPTEYASAGYLVFIPDIRYEPGHPANSAYDCIMSGTDAVLKKYSNVDSTRMGLQGQSWGGYQTAQLVTMTNRFKAAMAGAPVGNMFSAYGGIRWSTGMSRQFQYEKTQSRIGKTMWEAPELYIENSPVFHLPKVQTPLLIMHNDDDGAVPWYQGIEIFTGMRRLGKPCWLLNYNGDGHNLMKTANRRDLSIRMRQFFDHYLQNQPAPVWLTEGIPAVKKGKELRYELDQN
jgi:dipeptidyl aminopeptidase/acylaminoacyl peptidase